MLFRTTCLWSIGLLLSVPLCAQPSVNPNNITIARDEWGVPHIFGETDEEVAYGFGWATCEDDIHTLQELFLPIRGLAGQVFGKRGAVADVGVHLLEANSIVEERYEEDLSAEFRSYLEAFCAGVNAYVEHHPKEVLHKRLFPLTGKDIIKGYIVGMTLMSGVNRDLGAILSNRVKPIQKPTGSLAKVEAQGSNAFAVSAQKTTDGRTYLAINSHQPLEGPNSWYEAHLHSEEGLNILGGTFAGAPVIHLGVNPFLGWAHTLNYPDFADVYQLTMHPDLEGYYRFDGEWIQLERYDTKARIKVLGILKVGARQKFFKSKYGVTFKTERGYFALRFPANRDIRAAEQWYRMNKATNLAEFQDALKMQAIVCTNIVYADREDQIFYISNGRFPKRDPNYDWKSVLPGDTSATLWNDEYYSLDYLPQVLNPASGYVYNCNHTPFRSSGDGDNPDFDRTPLTTGFQPPESLTNRGVRFKELIDRYEKLSYDDFKTIKYDNTYHTPLKSALKLDAIFHLTPEKYPQIAESIRLLQKWDRRTDIDSKAAPLFIMAYDYLRKNLTSVSSLRTGNELNESLLVKSIESAEKHFVEFLGKKHVTLGELQRHRRGEADLPVSGGPDVLAALSASRDQDGRLKARAGDSYIQLVRFSANGLPEIETINAYGASAKPESPHYTDQMEMYVNQQLKPMTLSKAAVLKNAKRRYHPK